MLQSGTSVAISSILALGIGTTLVRAFPVEEGKTFALIQGLLIFPAGIPGIVAVAAWISLLGRTGWLGSLGLAYSFSAVIIAHVFFSAPYLSVQLSRAIREIPRLQVETVRSLGASEFSVFKTVVVPSVLPAFLESVLQVWIWCSTSFGVVLILGGGPPLETLETAIFSRLRMGSLDVSGALALAFWQFLIIFIPFALIHFFRSLQNQRGTEVEPKVPSGIAEAKRGAAIWAMKSLSVFWLLPYLAWITSSVRDGIRVGPRQEWVASLGFSVSVAFSVALIVVALSAVSVLTKIVSEFAGIKVPWIDLLVLLPSGVSSLVLGMALIQFYAPWIDPLEGSILGILALQSTLLWPLGFRTLNAVALQRQTSLWNVVRSLGASDWQCFWQIEWPRYKKPVFSLFTLVFAFSLGDVATVSLMSSAERPPLALLLLRWLNQYRIEEAAFIALLLLLLCGGASALGAGHWGRNLRKERS